jgi:enoyl-CoA hydratase/carnithine racemase
MSRAAELLFTGDMIDAATAEAWGLVSRVVPHDTLMEEAMALAAGSPRCRPMRSARPRACCARAAPAPTMPALELAASAQAIAHGTEDHAEGVGAFLDKRTPYFTGR